MVQIKICGIKTPEVLGAVIDAGSDFVGFVHYQASPRHLEIPDIEELAAQVPESVKSFLLTVNPSDAHLVVKGIDMIQLHGDETPERIVQIKTLTGLPVIKAIRVARAEDLEDVEAYETVADWLLFDAKPADAKLPGGTGKTFDWSLLAGRDFSKPWMLSGGLTPENVGEALAVLSPTAVDVSSGVESAPGVKDPQKIKSFIQAVNAAI